MSSTRVKRVANRVARCGIGVVALLVTTLPTISASEASPFEDALDAYHAGEHRQAIELWKSLPNDPRALFNLGQMYRRGEGVEPNHDAAIAYYERAAGMGHRSAQANLGTLYFFASPPQPDKALHWWRMAAIAGEPHAQHMMGVIYVNGEHVERDLIKGYAWNHIAAAQQYGKAQEAIATLDEYLTAEEIDAAKTLAITLLEQPVALAPATPPVELPEGQPSAGQPAPVATGYWLQFGALSDVAAARRLWQQLTDGHPDLTRDMESRISPLAINGKTLHRLQGGAFVDRDAARQRCTQFESAGVTCLVKSPGS